jgi:hypothetical protein
MDSYGLNSHIMAQLMSQCIVFRKRESVRPIKHCRYDVPTERKFYPTFDNEKDENEKYH